MALYLIFCCCFRAILSVTQESLLILCSGIIPGRIMGTIWGAEDQSHVGHIQGKHSPFSFFFGRGGGHAPGSAHGLLSWSYLCSGITPGIYHGTIWDSWEWTWINYMQGKHPSCGPITLALVY